MTEGPRRSKRARGTADAQRNSASEGEAGPSNLDEPAKKKIHFATRQTARRGRGWKSKK